MDQCWESGAPVSDAGYVPLQAKQPLVREDLCNRKRGPLQSGDLAFPKIPQHVQFWPAAQLCSQLYHKDIEWKNRGFVGRTPLRVTNMVRHRRHWTGVILDKQHPSAYSNAHTQVIAISWALPIISMLPCQYVMHLAHLSTLVSVCQMSNLGIPIAAYLSPQKACKSNH